MGQAAVVTVFLRHGSDVLLVRRAADADTYPGRWAGVSGYLERDDPVATARMELREETGITAAELVRSGEPLEVVDGETRWLVHPVLFESASRTVRLNEELTVATWVPPPEMLRRETVPGLWDAYRRVAPSPETVAADTEHGSASLSVRALEALRDGAATAESFDAVRSIARDLLAARPTMAVLENRINRAMDGATAPTDVLEAARDGIERAGDMEARAAEEGAALLRGDRLLTLSRSGTVLAALRLADPEAVVVAESRPACEGVGVAEELAEEGIDVAVCTDAAVAWVLASHGPIDAVVVGADAILPDGRVVNKTGTRAAALAAAYESVPVYVVASTDKVSTTAEPHLENGATTAVYDGPAGLEPLNPIFDVTPADLVTGILTERGQRATDELDDVLADHRAVAAWADDGRR